MKSLDELLRMNDYDIGKHLYIEAIHINKRLEPVYENIIKTIPQWAYHYALNILKDRWPEAEPYILKNEIIIIEYITNVIKERWPEAELIIMKDPYNAYLYAYRILKRRWPEAEPYIMKDPPIALNYARFVIQGRWPEAEPYIKRNLYLFYVYFEEFIKDK